MPDCYLRSTFGQRFRCSSMHVLQCGAVRSELVDRARYPLRFTRMSSLRCPFAWNPVEQGQFFVCFWTLRSFGWRRVGFVPLRRSCDRLSRIDCRIYAIRRRLLEESPEARPAPRSSPWPARSHRTHRVAPRPRWGPAQCATNRRFLSCIGSISATMAWRIWTNTYRLESKG